LLVEVAVVGPGLLAVAVPEGTDALYLEKDQVGTLPLNQHYFSLLARTRWPSALVVLAVPYQVDQEQMGQKMVPMVPHPPFGRSPALVVAVAVLVMHAPALLADQAAAALGALWAQAVMPQQTKEKMGGAVRVSTLIADLAVVVPILLEVLVVQRRRMALAAAASPAT
jgi:hypothetical protein